MTTIIAFIVIFCILVVVHEFGHFYFAKRSGILVREFSIGMGPKLWASRKNNTTYTLRLLPLGGYVRMAGWQDDEDDIKPGTMLSLILNDAGKVVRINASDKTTLEGGMPVQVSRVDLVKDLVIEGYPNGDEEALQTWHVDHDATIIEEDGTEVQIAPEDVQFQNAPVWRRLLVNFAGPMNNFILAILTFIVYGLVFGVQIFNTNQVGTVLPDYPAAQAGLKSNARVESIDGKKIHSFTDLSTQVSKHAGKSVKFTVKQDGKTQNIAIKPDKEGKIGVMVPVDKSPVRAFTYGFTQTWDLAVRTWDVLKSMVTGGFSLNKLAGPVGIYTMTSQSAKGGLAGLLFFMGYLSLGLGISNLLPIPVLDGGKILLNLIEIIRRKPLKQETEGVITMIGLGLMVLLMIAVTINDIMRYF
ncbi:RIP metalloprotease RseP [Lacticaseibacillus chiayiensis]|uniref:Zinc metalloprotease n=1 Tax=Lacticaseibacillus chiayiensis TaxID=2100821 RepID=A0A4Q1TLG7_9LACO|nr:RIP metalloprotease RseP [Lacticaseibacillus chiayiensis]QVI33563.1 RIP metalloprotease RseP [Lacticaseibacillus chiayiensis]RXT19087.1 RIP metalloprotease RseP [Lacticaseibacillus chiayiensis]RXT58170.1 RIP metalloprotease RseP [Lacticaseibacillus chiayiensis]UYN55307.1 RIP metalloprotease RseP [Lacticaseibacillus chiayiensis]